MTILTQILAILLLLAWAFVWAVCLLGWRTARGYAGKRIPSKLDSPGVTIIRPLCGLDANMFNTLETVMKLEYPKFEVLFAVQDDQDEALPVVKMVMDKYPHVDARVVINKENVGVNAKVNNLMKPFEEAKYDLLWVIDVTIAVTPGMLGRAVEAFDMDEEWPEKGDVGLVHHVPYAVVYQKTWGSRIEQAYLNSTHAKMYLAINATGIESCVVGKSCLYSKASINSLDGGLGRFASFLAEDNMIGLAIWHQLGLTHGMTTDVALDYLGALSLGQYVSRRIRWIRVRKVMTLPATLAEPFTESIVCGLYGSWAVSRLLGAEVYAIWLVHMALWLMVDLSVRRNLGGEVIGSTLEFVVAWVMREVMALPIWVVAMVGSEVVWRGRRYRMLANGGYHVDGADDR